MSDFEDEIAELWAEVQALKDRLEPPDAALKLRVPDIAEFVTSPEFLAMDLTYPDHLLVLKLHFLQTDLLTAEDHATLARWSQGFAPPIPDPNHPVPHYTGEHGISPDILDRVGEMVKLDRKWFRTSVWPWGRRAGKNHLAAIAVLYLLWQVMALGDPTTVFPIRKGKIITAGIFASSKEQALTGMWWDIVQIAAAAPCFAPWIVDITQQGLVLATPADMARNDPTSKGTLAVTAFAANRVAGRGKAMICQVFDEMAFVTKADSAAPAEEIFDAVTPALDQFRGWSMIMAISSPWQRTGKFYELAQEALEVDPGTGTAAYPETYLAQFNSWELYDSWADAHHRAMVPNAIAKGRPYHRHPDGKVRRYLKLPGPIQAFDRELQQEKRKNPVLFAVEREAHWADVANPAFNRDDIAGLWIDTDGEPVQQMDSVPLMHRAVMHIDPAFRHDNTAWAIGYSYRLDEHDLWRTRVVRTQHLRPMDYAGHKVDLQDLLAKVISDINRFQVRLVTVDQHNGESIAALLQQAVRDRKITTGARVEVFDQTPLSNAEVLETFREAITNRLIDCPYDGQLDDELRFATITNGKLAAPDTGPCTTDDVLDAVMIMNHHVRTASWVHAQLSGTTLHATRGPADRDQGIFDQLGSLGRRRRPPEGHNPARGRRPPR
jgi:hypothetical protein